MLVLVWVVEWRNWPDEPYRLLGSPIPTLWSRQDARDWAKEKDPHGTHSHIRRYRLVPVREKQR